MTDAERLEEIRARHKPVPSYSGYPGDEECEACIGAEEGTDWPCDTSVVLAEVERLRGVGRPRIVCLCGSTRFAEEMNRQGEIETLAGSIVVRPEVVAYSSGNDPQIQRPEVKAALDELHLRKIDLADEVLVVNVGGYIGDSTRNEIVYATAQGKPIRWLEAKP